VTVSPIFPPLPDVEDRYPFTTDYYWGTIEANMTMASGAEPETGLAVSPLFKTTLVLRGDECAIHENWFEDPCGADLANCEDGLSVGVWVKIDLGNDGEIELNRTDFEMADRPRRYLLSTGGDDQGHPGFAIYVQGHKVWAIVSTGDKYWKISSTAMLRSNQWTNIGIRWSNVETRADYGLKLFTNANDGLVVWAVNPDEEGVVAKPALDPPRLMAGCHATSTDSNYRDYGDMEMDEIAMWMYAINNTLFFLGGFDAHLDNTISLLDVLDDLADCVATEPPCTTNPDIFPGIVRTLVTVSAAPSAVQITPTDPSDPEAVSAAAEKEEQMKAIEKELPEGTRPATEEELTRIQTIYKIFDTLTAKVPPVVNKEGDLRAFMAVVQLWNEMLDPANYAAVKTQEYNDKENGGMAAVLERLVEFLLNCAAHITIEPKDLISEAQSLSNFGIQVSKCKVFKFRQEPNHVFPKEDSSGSRRRRRSLLDDDSVGLDTIQVSAEVFHNEHEDTPFVDQQIVFSESSTYKELAPNRAYKGGMGATDDKQVYIDGKVLGLRYKLTPGVGMNASQAELAQPTEEQMRKHPLIIRISHVNTKKAERSLRFHDNEINSGIMRRHCVRWNKKLFDYGGWDPTGCRAVESNEFYTKCACNKFGDFAILIEKVAPKIVDLEYEWLKIMKYTCYGISALLLLIFIITVIRIKSLHEQFHLMRLQTAIGLFIGSIFMCLTDLDEIRDDRHLCTAFGAVIHFFYLMAGVMTFCEGLADFMSVTNGAIGGKLRCYVAFSWGVALLSLGYAMLMHIHDYGTDPRCFIGWEDEVKLTMFIPLAVAMGGSFIFACLVSCNMQASKLRKENIVAEQLTVCKGYIFYAFYFVVTWTVAVIAYMKLGLAIPSFYPLFQVLNSTGGIIFFLFCGVGSERFRLLISGKADFRRKMLFSYTVSEQLTESQQQLVVEEERPATPEQEYDPYQRGPRKPIVA